MTARLALAPLVVSPFTTSTDENPHSETYKEAIRAERTAETNSIVAAWEAGHTFRAHDDPPHEIARITGMSESYINKRIRLAGHYTKPRLMAAIDRSGACHITAFYSWTFGTQTHASNQMFRQRNVHVPQEHHAYFEAIGVNVAELLKEFLSTIEPSELHALIRARVPESATA